MGIRRFTIGVSLVAASWIGPLVAQMRVVPLDDMQGHVALGLALRHLANTGVFLMATAHPDDENNGLLVMLNRGQGFRTALATATRGSGGQNEIGTELSEALAVLRTEELAAAHRFDGAEQYFTRAVDFGYSFSVEETLEKWGRDEILGDFVRLIRMIRPDVIAGLWPSGAGGGQHHQASALLALEAYKAAGDPSRYPEQIKADLRAWQPKKFYYGLPPFMPASATPRAGRQVTVNLAVFDRLLGKTYAEIGAEARSMHMCQGTEQLLALPGPSLSSYELAESTIAGQSQREEASLFDGVDTSIQGLAQLAGGKAPRDLTSGLGAIASAVQAAQKQFDASSTDGVLQALLAGLRAVRALRGQLRSMALSDGGRFDIDFRLRQKEREFQQAILIASGIRVEALADDGLVVPGQDVGLSLTVANRGAADVTVTQIRIEGFDGEKGCTLTSLGGGAGASAPGRRGRGRGAAPAAAPAGAPTSVLRRDQVARCQLRLRVPANARISEPYWHREGEAGRYTLEPDAPFGLPYRPTDFYAQVTLTFGSGEEVIHGLTVQHRYEGGLFSGEKRSELLVVPPISVQVSPEIVIVPSSALVPPPPAAPPVSLGRGGTGRGSAPSAGGGRGAAGGTGRGATGTSPTGAGRGRGTTPAPPSPPSSPPPPAAPGTLPGDREIRVTVVNGSNAPVSTLVRLQLPAGWTTTPAEQSVSLSRENESRTIRYQVRPATGTAAGAYRIRAIAAAGEASIDRGYQAIEYPHIRRQHVFRPADVTVRVTDVRTAPNLTVGYIMGVGDEVPAAIEQLGVKVDLLGPDALAWGDLSKYSTIVTGVRAYERRADLRSNNGRLLEYVRNGGTLVVQYNKMEFNDAQFGPYAASVGTDRVADENTPVVILQPSDPVFSIPNRINDEAWKGWVQERGLYFLGERDSRYRDLISLEDPFPNNRGEKRGALVSTQFGKGRWIYVGLGLWRQLPAGIEGAYHLLANLISLGALR
jgi:LmbE family N-acetylglucosaminyl deacetylase